MQVDTSKSKHTVEKLGIKRKGPCSTLLFLVIVIENLSVISLINASIPHLHI